MRLTNLFLAGLILPATASAAFSIVSVSNAASRIPTGFPSYGIAQGAVFSVIGTGVGQDPPTQATFPLPTAAGLSGVSIKITVGSTSVNAIMVYVSANEVDAILPSNTPVGAGTITVTNGGASANTPITVVPAAFGIFTTPPGGFGLALAFTTADDGTTAMISPAQPAQPGQTVTLAGTGLGAISGDETQSGAGGTPNATPVVWVGNQQVAATSSGRGSCCAGLDPTYPIPQGIASWDLISFVVPSGVSGCTVSVAVQVANMISNAPSIAIAGSNGMCYDLSGISLDPTTLSGTIKTGLEGFTRVVTRIYGAAGTSVITSDGGAASFQAVTFDPTLALLPANLLAFSAAFVTGNCTAQVFRFDRSNPPPTPPAGNPGTPPTFLDAGPAINVTGPVAAMPMKKVQNAGYGGQFALINSIPLGSGLPPITSGGPPFLNPGNYTLDNGAGGADIGPFSVNFVGPPLLNWDNIDQVTTINRAQGVDIKWSGTDPTTIVGIGGAVTIIQGTVSLSGSFQCTEKASAGHFVIPPWVTLSMPQVSLMPTPPNLGTITVSDLLYNYLPIPGVDINVLTWISGTGRNVGFQ
jgi:uncharacterized protein (TIGR03437 family)